MTRFEPETPQHPFSCCASHLLYTDMSVKVIVVFALLVAPLVCGAASSSESPAAGEAKEARNAQHDALQQLLAKRERASDAAHRRETAPRTRSAQTVRRAHLSEDEREIMTKQIMQAISEMMNSECMPDRDYQGWVDFGRRDAD
ncbi:putative gastrin/cholecystokinin-like peptide-like [Scophthalmus maximus]|uniref:Putative gastrin/cholecystokinin-like peptide-like n=1 Tax=Scophthalmus maximus TaxID=52904 RepID=A0A2U9BPP0_SCOMX|nr:putative gastrin/cholecystokinin-like peptide-like [Scophthalmus maximus]